MWLLGRWAHVSGVPIIVFERSIREVAVAASEGVPFETHTTAVNTSAWASISSWVLLLHRLQKEGAYSTPRYDPQTYD